MKKICLMVLLYLCVPFSMFGQKTTKLSFGVISDTHFENHAGEGAIVKTSRALKNLTSICSLDALFVVGDLTNYGYSEQYEKLISVFGDNNNYQNSVDDIILMLGNHDMVSKDGKKNYQESLRQFNNGEDYPLHTYRVIKGYPFITLSQLGVSCNDTANPNSSIESYPPETLDTLETYLKRATSQCPNKPIFVFTHVPPRYTCYGSWAEFEGDDWSTSRLNPILNKYPQCIVFCGHCHYPLGDPRCIHQGVNQNSPRENYYTVVGTGSSTYSEINPGAVDVGIHPKYFVRVTEGLIVSEQDNGDIEIRRYDTYRNQEIGNNNRWIIKAPFDGSMFEYGDTRDRDDNPLGRILRDGAPAPSFPSGTVLDAESGVNEIKLLIPQAKDNDCVFRYGVKITKEGQLIAERFFFSQFYLNSDMPDTLVCTIDSLSSNTNYHFEVKAYDSYDNASHPIVGMFSTLSELSDEYPKPYAYWTFDSDNPLYSCQKDYADLLPVSIESGEVVIRSSMDQAGIFPVAGIHAGDKAIFIPHDTGLKLVLDDGKAKNNYTIIMDIKQRDAESFNALIQTSMSNLDDADVFVSNHQIGIAEIGYYGYISENEWHRIAFVNRDGNFNIYVDGSSLANGAGSRWVVDAEGVYLFLDDSNERVDMELAGLYFWEIPLSDRQIKNLGNGIINTDINRVQRQRTSFKMYDLSGKMIDENAHGAKVAEGIYIKEGKKVFIK